MESEAKALAEFGGRASARVALWESLECLRGVHIAKARAAEALTIRWGISRADALAELQTDPQWIIAEQGCR